MRHMQDSKTTATEYIDYVNRSFKIITYCNHNARYLSHRDVYYLAVKCKLNYIHKFLFLGSQTKADRKEEVFDFAPGVKMASSAPGETRRHFGTRATYIS